MDAADLDKIQDSRTELHDLLLKPSLDGIPVLIVGNKNDLDNAMTSEELVEAL